MPIINKEKWDVYVKKNQNPYGKAAVDVAKEAMDLLDTDKYEKLDTHKLICDADIKSELTGFLAGAVAQMVTECHSRGKEFQKIWNISHGIKKEEAEEGIVNPAILTIKT